MGADGERVSGDARHIRRRPVTGGCCKVKPGQRARLRRRRSLMTFVRQNRKALDVAIRRAMNCDRKHEAGIAHRLNDEERRLWVLNDEDLYRWAEREGVRL